MPYQRKGGRVIKVDSAPVRGKTAAHAVGADGLPTDRIDEPASEDSLFGPKDNDSVGAARREASTVPWIMARRLERHGSSAGVCAANRSPINRPTLCAIRPSAG